MAQRQLLDVARHRVEIVVDQGWPFPPSTVFAIDEKRLSAETTWFRRLNLSWSDIRSVSHGRSIIGEGFDANGSPLTPQRVLALDLKFARPCNIRLPNLSTQDYATLLLILGNIAALRGFDLLTDGG